MWVTASEVRTNSKEMFSYELLHMDMPVLGDQQKLMEGCKEDVPRLMDYHPSISVHPLGMDDERESGNPVLSTCIDDDKDDENIKFKNVSVLQHSRNLPPQSKWKFNHFFFQSKKTLNTTCVSTLYIPAQGVMVLFPPLHSNILNINKYLLKVSLV